MLPFSFVQAETASNLLNLEYKTFYSHLRKIDIEDTPGLQFAFGFVNTESKVPCVMKNVTIHTPKIDIPVALDALNRFSLPKERALKLADAEVNVQFQNAGFEACQLSVLLEANPRWLAELPLQTSAIPGVELSEQEKSKLNIVEPKEPPLAKTHISAERLAKLNTQFQQFFESMGGGLFGFMMPETLGLKLYLKPDYQASQLLQEGLAGMNQEGELIKLDTDWINQNQQALPLAAISHITAWVEN
ncbi:DUF2987 domain-containing protein [Alteromonas sp. a30]|uniref:DUF2987 domain-containing protein n=1 Tax=Alteromonas sp. a30 TaxID=2730917 RepID=UPI002282C05C|nr:DUF2987 domain-containing protein [Alteromonas sp. a30]MCY7293875.1 DUF2987 domain-containing protein [Alteromonas sp. a30]